VIGTPSHDGTAATILNDIFKSNDDFLKVIVADHPMQIYFDGECIGAVDEFPQDALAEGSYPDAILSLIPTPTKQYYQGTDQEISQAMNGLFMGFGAQAAEYNCPHVLVGHWNVSGSKLPNGHIRTGMDIEISTDQMMLAQPDLGCLGHIHIAQKLGDRFFFSGPIYSTKIDEVGPNGFYIHTLEGKRLVSSEFIQTPCMKLFRATSDYTKGPLPDLGEYPAYLFTSEIIIRECAGASVRVDLTVWQDEAALIPKDEIKQLYLDAGALDVDVRLNAVPRETVRAAAVLEAETLKDEFSEMAKLRGEEIDPEILPMVEQLENIPAEELLKTIAEAA